MSIAIRTRPVVRENVDKTLQEIVTGAQILHALIHHYAHTQEQHSLAENFIKAVFLHREDDERSSDHPLELSGDIRSTLEGFMLLQDNVDLPLTEHSVGAHALNHMIECAADLGFESSKLGGFLEAILEPAEPPSWHKGAFTLSDIAPQVLQMFAYLAEEHRKQTGLDIRENIREATRSFQHEQQGTLSENMWIKLGLSPALRSIILKPNLDAKSRVEESIGEILVGDRFIFPSSPDPLFSVESGKPCRVTKVTLEGVEFRRWLMRGHYTWDRLETEIHHGLERCLGQSESSDEDIDTYP